MNDESLWPDAMFGEYGTLETDGTRVRCHICGKWYRALGLHVHLAHEMSADDYREAFGLLRSTALAGEEYRAKQRATTDHLKPYHGKYQDRMRAAAKISRPQRLAEEIRHWRCPDPDGSDEKIAECKVCDRKFVPRQPNQSKICSYDCLIKLRSARATEDNVAKRADVRVKNSTAARRRHQRGMYKRDRRGRIAVPGMDAELTRLQAKWAGKLPDNQPWFLTEKQWHAIGGHINELRSFAELSRDRGVTETSVKLTAAGADKLLDRYAGSLDHANRLGFWAGMSKLLADICLELDITPVDLIDRAHRQGTDQKAADWIAEQSGIGIDRKSFNNWRRALS